MSHKQCSLFLFAVLVSVCKAEFQAGFFHKRHDEINAVTNMHIMLLGTLLQY